MRHLARTKKGGYIVAKLSGRNGKEINSSEPLKTKRSAYGNMIADMKVDGINVVKFQDDCGARAVVKIISKSGTIITQEQIKPSKKYQPK